MNDSEIAAYVDLWLSMKPYINAKDKDIACEKFLDVINEHICDLTEVGDEWFGFDSTLDRILRDNYYENEINDDYDSDEDDDW